MSVVKVIELVGQSDQSWDDAGRKAVEQAAKTIDGISGAEVTNMTADVENGKITKYRATVKVAFLVKDKAG